MTGISQAPNQELRDIKKRDNHRNFTTIMRLSIGNVKENPFVIQFQTGTSLPVGRPISAIF